MARLCLQGRSTKAMAAALAVSPYTVQDHLKAIFRKTGVRTRGELVGQVFLEHYVPRWERRPMTPRSAGRSSEPAAMSIAAPAGLQPNG